MVLVITIISIFSIAFAAWLAGKILPFRICPVCAGVAGTWLWLLAGIYLNLLKTENWQLIIAVLMGGSVVGVAYQTAKRLLSSKSEVLFKALFIPSGFVAVYGLLMYWWLLFYAAIVFSAILALLFLRKRGNEKAANKRVEEIKKRMEDCC